MDKESGFGSVREQRVSGSPHCPDLLWDPRVSPIPWVLGIFAVGKRNCSMKQTTHLHLVRKLRMSGAMPSLPLTYSWQGA
jgi:hypothetical protein